MAATRLYLRFTNANVGTHARTEKSVALPVGTFVDGNFAAKDLSTTKGAAQTSTGVGSLAQQTHQDEYIGKFISAPLTVGQIDANTWTVGLASMEGNANAHCFTTLSIYVLKSDDTVRGFVYDSDTPLGVEWLVTEDGQVLTVSGSAVAGVVGTDQLALEVWVHAVQSASMAYSNQIWLDGATDVVDTTTADAASYIETPQDLFVAAAAPSVVKPFNPIPFQAQGRNL